jgi:hypothetical protein
VSNAAARRLFQLIEPIAVVTYLVIFARAGVAHQMTEICRTSGVGTQLSDPMNETIFPTCYDRWLRLLAAGRRWSVGLCVWVGVLDVVAAALRLTRRPSLIDVGVAWRLGGTGEASVELLFP